MLIRRNALAWLLVALFALALSGVASAHSELVSSDPKDGAALSAAPSKVTLIFSEELAEDGNLITVKDASGEQVDNGDTALDLNDPNRVTVTVTLKSGLGAGIYTVEWKNMSSDGHSEEGSLSFSVAASAAPTTAAPPSVPATGAGDGLSPAVFALAALLLAGIGIGLRRRAR